MPESLLSTFRNSHELTLTTSQVLADTVRHLVDRPDRVEIKTREDGRTVLLILYVAPNDIGRVIGREGRTARSLRVLLSSISNKTGIHFDLDIQAERV